MMSRNICKVRTYGAEGLPLGIQVVAKAWEDDVALSVAETLEHGDRFRQRRCPG